MKPERWDEINRLYHSALELEPGDRAAFVKQACGGDESLQKEVLSLIGRPPEVKDLLEYPAIEEAAKGLAGDQADATAATLAAQVPPEVPVKGSILIDGKYRLECRLGQGGMGTVYRVRHEILDKDFALKLIRLPKTGDTSFAHRFRLEAKALGKLKHPNIVNVTDYGVDPRGDGMPYLVMEYLQGQTLGEHIRTRGPLSPGEALPLLEQIAQAVDYAHQRGVLHCDLKPGNIFLSGGDGELRIAKILDFGLAQLIQPALRRTEPTLAAADARSFTPPSQQITPKSTAEKDAVEVETVISGSATNQPRVVSEWQAPAGTPAYMPPEVIRGGCPTEASDIYALGVLAYQVLIGVLPFAGSPTDIIQGHLYSAPPTPSSLGARLSEDVEKALLAPLEKSPIRRPRNAVEMVEAIRSAYLAAERRKWLAREIPRRLSVTAVMALALGLLSIPLLNSRRAQDIERRTVDARFALQPLHAPDPRILIITVDDASLAADQTLLSERADEFGAQLGLISTAGAGGIAIDFLLPYSWSRSESFSRFVLSSASVLTLASFSSPSGETIGTNCLAGLTASALGPDALRSLFGFVNLDEDSDGVARQAPFFYSDSSGGRWDTWAIRAARSVVDLTHRIEASATRRGSFWIDYSADWQKMERISWKDLSRYLESNRSSFRHRLVLVGGDYAASGDDYHRVPTRVGSPGAVSGIMLEALIVNTILADIPIRETGESTRHLAVILLCAAALAGALCIPRLSLFAMVFTSVYVLYLLAAFLLFRWSNLILPMAGPLVMGLVALGISLTLRSVLSAFPSQIRRSDVATIRFDP